MRPPLPYRGREREQRQACQMPGLRGVRSREGVRGGGDAYVKGRGEVPGQGRSLTAPPVPLFTRAHERGVLENSATGRSGKLTAYGAVPDPDGGWPSARRSLSRSRDLKLKGDRTVVSCFLYHFPLPDPAAVEDQRGQRAGVDETRVQLVVF
jgi:hypothetical protein